MRLRVIGYFLAQYKFLYGTILVLTLFASVLESLSLAAFLPLFSTLLDDSEREGGILGIMDSMLELLPFSDRIVSACVLIICIFLLKTVFTLAREALIAYSSGRVLYDVKNRTLGRYANAHYEFILDNKQGTLIYNTLQAPQYVAHLLLIIAKINAEFLKVVAVLVVLGFISLYATLALIGLGVVYFLGIHYISNRVTYTLGQGRANAGTELTVIANEFLNGIRQITIFDTARSWLSRFDGHNRTYSEVHAKNLVWLTIPKSLMELTAIVLMMGFLLILWFFSQDTFTSTLPKLGVFAIAMVQLLPALTAIGRMRMEMMGDLPDVELSYHSLVDPVPRTKDGSKVLASFDQAIMFEDVSFAYKGRDSLLDHVNMTFEKGKVTAIVGPSGGGKTTLINLILGLFEPTEGFISVDGLPLRQYKAESWLSKIGFVSQDSFIYNSTVAENIDFGRNGHSTESIINAARIANAHGFISELPQGYDTIVGDRGMKLSGGQQQRIAIARAILNQPEILIFDEATSSLDSVSEKLVQQAIDNVARERTVIIIAHRLSTVRGANKIIVLDEGRVIEQGSHAELLERDGHYSRLVASST